MTNKLKIETDIHEEYVTIYLNDYEIVSANYDEHGFAGIEIAQEVAVAMAHKLGIEIETVYTDLEEDSEDYAEDEE